MQDNPARKKPGYAGRVYKPRQCEDCPAIFQPKSSGQKRCEDCQYQENLKRSREHEARKRKAAFVPKHCVDCAAELPSYRGMHSKRCETCRDAYWKAHNRERNAARTADGTRKQYDQRYREENAETVRVSSQKYRKAHPETDQAAIHRRRQRREVRMDEVDRILSAQYRLAIRHDACLYCGSMENHEVDHFFPLSKGGTDHWWNLVPACRTCNRGAGGKRQMCGTAFLLLKGTLTTALRPAA